MICRPCCAAADITAAIRRDVARTPRPASMSAMKTWNLHGAEAADLHQTCRGCDCQHGGITIGFDPGAPGNDLDTMPAPRTVADLAALNLLPRTPEGAMLTPGPLHVHVDDRSGAVIAVTHHDTPLPYVLESRRGPGVGSPPGQAITVVHIATT